MCAKICREFHKSVELRQSKHFCIHFATMEDIDDQLFHYALERRDRGQNAASSSRAIEDNTEASEEAVEFMVDGVMLINRGKVTHKFRCHLCTDSRDFPHWKALRKHLHEHVEGKSLSCTLCPETFTDSESMVQHILSHKPAANHECRVCGKVFKNSTILTCHLVEGDPIIRHDISASDSSQFKKCLECDRFFIDDRYFNLHMAKYHTATHNASNAINTRKRRQRETSTSAKMSLRKRRYEAEEDDEHKCEICDGNFDSEELLLRHIKASHLR
ncbi:protein suppressor of hairy wing-like isoform X2 [Phlebotomus argentipes]|uniref:protein suppressor of hairy wing-like isoform X2 n=1 Tax=Phlebotomus argentipes TaxID=94469 RepID=UPI002892F70D|nr:protein suppressor of hairy wing-like isoform X2 [Phlebotomus argentipes]